LQRKGKKLRETKPVKERQPLGEGNQGTGKGEPEAQSALRQKGGKMGPRKKGRGETSLADFAGQQKKNKKKKSINRKEGHVAAKGGRTHVKGKGELASEARGKRKTEKGGHTTKDNKKGFGGREAKSFGMGTRPPPNAHHHQEIKKKKNRRREKENRANR